MTGTPAEAKNNMDRNDLIAELKSYIPETDIESSYLPRFLDLLTVEKCFYRDCFPAHITGSAILLDQTGTKILMNHHKSLNRWLNFGGHCDGEEDILSVAIRETMEESGLSALSPISPRIADIDIHPIPANPKKNEPAHKHYDIRYILKMTADETPIISDESLDLQWMDFNQALEIIPDNDGLTRLIRKAMTW